MWNDYLGNMFKAPDEIVHIRNGKEWTRTHETVCPMCRGIFYGYEPRDSPFEPRYNPLANLCGHPLCQAAYERGLNSESQYRKASGDFYSKKNAETPESRPGSGSAPGSSKNLVLSGLRSASK
jgi:hypothetical protein